MQYYLLIHTGNINKQIYVFLVKMEYLNLNIIKQNLKESANIIRTRNEKFKFQQDNKIRSIRR